MSLDQQFKEAAEKSRQLPNQSSDNLLKIYSLYKQATVGDVQGSRPGAFDFRGRAKYDAWAKLKGTSTEDAQKQYVELINTLSS